MSKKTVPFSKVFQFACVSVALSSAALASEVPQKSLKSLHTTIEKFDSSIPYRLHTIELSQEEVVALGYDLLPAYTPPKSPAENAEKLSSVLQPTPLALPDVVGIVNTIAELIRRVMALDMPLMKGTLIGEAVPKDATVFELAESKLGGHIYRKVLKGWFGEILVGMDYKVEYAYGANYQNKGKYIPHVQFTTLHLVLNPTWRIDADAQSFKPRNTGKADDPIAALEFNVAFKVKSLQTIMTNDSFSLDGGTGELTAQTTDFNWDSNYTGF